jgi:hypothetical protein
MYVYTPLSVHNLIVATSLGAASVSSTPSPHAFPPRTVPTYLRSASGVVVLLVFKVVVL